jgi:hypothetical protein
MTGVRPGSDRGQTTDRVDAPFNKAYQVIAASSAVRFKDAISFMSGIP